LENISLIDIIVLLEKWYNQGGGRK